MSASDWLLRALAKGPELLGQWLRDALWQRLLHCPGLSVGSGALIIGDRQMRLGAGFRAGRMLWLEAVGNYGSHLYQPSLVIGERVSCSDSVHIACIQSVVIGNDVLIGSKVHITDHNHGCYSGGGEHSSPNKPPATRALVGSPVCIGNKVFLADGVVVLPGSQIGDGAIVGANSVVSGCLPAFTICVGTPARPVKVYSSEKSAWVALRGTATSE
jgi:acetyltransferase-like isoleucine patch superfamily enzyme